MSDNLQVPDSWKPKQAPEPIQVPPCDLTNPAVLEAFFGPFGQWDLWRKCVLASCSEIIRAEFTLSGEKITETRIDTLSRLHGNYLQFLIDGLKGRTLREQNVLDSGVR